MNHLLPSLKLPRKIEDFFDMALEKFFILFGLAEFRDDFKASDIQLRSFCFLDEMKKRRAICQAMKTFVGYNNRFKIKIHGKTFRFESLPTASFKNKYTNRIADDKKLTKQHCKKGGFPIAHGKSFWFWQKKKAVRFGVQQLGFPLVLKPRFGSVSHHVTTNIQNSEELENAINYAISYSPAYIVEKFITDSSVYRATIIDFDFVACVKQLPANVVGDGASTMSELIYKKNADPQRGGPNQKEFTLYKIVEDETTTNLLRQKGYDHKTILKNGEIFYLQKDPFLKLGGDLIEVTPAAHPDNIELFRSVARFFDTRITGIDFIAKDIALSWKNQTCAILELNSAPCIELHHFPSSGAPTNPAGALTDMFFKYYL